MVQGQSDCWYVGPIGVDCLHLALAHGSQRQGMELPCDPEGHSGMPSPGQPGAAAVLVAAAGPEGL
eukprot:3665321-Alexandrium_andersonii.AAC.1